MIIEHLFPEEHIILLQNTEKQHVIKEMLMKLEELKKISNAERYYAQIMHRESLENTGIGSGFAIPHTRTDSVGELISIFGVSSEGIDYLSLDKIPVTYVLLNIFPTSLSTRYLYLVGMMARIFSNSDKRRLINKAKNPSELFTLLKKEANSYFDSISQSNPASATDIEDLSGVPSCNLDLLIRLERLYNLLDKSDPALIIQTKISELKKIIDNRSLTYYERMRKKFQTPFAILDKTSCSGCHMGLAPIYLAQIKERDDIKVCNHCGRFLVIL
jgi:mannitol/fructose-specific phosphotransferase system IIA component (Ntr-type)